MAGEATARASAISAEVTARNAAIAASIGSIVDAPTWAASTTYAVGQLVKFDDPSDSPDEGVRLYSCLVAHTSSSTLNPTNTTNWNNLGAYSSITESVANNAASIVEIETLDANSTKTIVTKINAISTAMGDPPVAAATKIGQLETKASDNEDGLAAQVSDFTELRAAVYGVTTIWQADNYVIGDRVIYGAVSYTHLTLPTTPYL